MENKENSKKCWPVVIAVVALLVFIAVCYFKFCSHSSSNEGTVVYYIANNIANNYVFICAFIVLFSLFNIRTFIADHWPLIFAVTTGLLVVAVYLHQFYGNPISSDPEKWGPFGDYIGGILNPTFTFIMLYLVWQTLAVQREEFELQRNELKKQKEAQERLEKDLQHQKFEDRFFKILDLYLRVVKEVNVSSNLFLDTSWYPGNSTGYQTFFNSREAAVRDYLRMILVILRFLNESTGEVEKKKKECAVLFGTMLSNNEKVLLYYHCLSFAKVDQELCDKELCDLVNEFSLIADCIKPE